MDVAQGWNTCLVSTRPWIQFSSITHAEWQNQGARSRHSDKIPVSIDVHSPCYHRVPRELCIELYVELCVKPCVEPVCLTVLKNEGHSVLASAFTGLGRSDSLSHQVPLDPSGPAPHRRAVPGTWKSWPHPST